MKNQPNQNVRQFKQTFVRYNIHINRRDFDGKWEVVKKIPCPQYSYNDTLWKGGRTAEGNIIKPMVWVTYHVFDKRSEAMTRAREMGGIKTS